MSFPLIGLTASNPVSKPSFSMLLTVSSDTFNVLYLLGSLLAGYSFAWTGHFFIEHNRPATFKYPIYSFIGDHLMYLEILKGKHKIF